MFKIHYSSQFKRDLKRIKKSSANDFRLLFELVLLLESGGKEKIPAKHKAHTLKGNYKGYYELHVLPDLLLIWKQNNKEKIISLTRAGSHSELFK